jgi:hypothetical protein
MRAMVHVQLRRLVGQVADAGERLEVRVWSDMACLFCARGASVDWRLSRGRRLRRAFSARRAAGRCVGVPGAPLRVAAASLSRAGFDGGRV